MIIREKYPLLQATQVNISSFGQKISKVEPPPGRRNPTPHSGAAHLRRTSVLGRSPKPWRRRNSSFHRIYGPSGPRRQCGVNSERSEELHRGGFAAPSISITEGWSRPLGGGTQKRKTRLPSCLSFLVEAGGVEPPSENSSMGTSPGADGYSGGLAPPVPLSPGKPSRLRVR